MSTRAAVCFTVALGLATALFSLAVSKAQVNPHAWYAFVLSARWVWVVLLAGTVVFFFLAIREWSVFQKIVWVPINFLVRNPYAGKQATTPEMRRFLQVDSPDYIANGELRSVTMPTILPPGRIVVDVTDMPDAESGDIYDPITKSFSPPFPYLQLQFPPDSAQYPVASALVNIDCWYALRNNFVMKEEATGRLIIDSHPYTVFMVIRKPIPYRQVLVSFSCHPAPNYEVKWRERRAIMVFISENVPACVMEIRLVR